VKCQKPDFFGLKAQSLLSIRKFITSRKQAENGHYKSAMSGSYLVFGPNPPGDKPHPAGLLTPIEAHTQRDRKAARPKWDNHQ